VIGAVALAAASVVAAPLVATSYAAFFVFVANALVRHLPIASCGCFGKADTPPSRVHLGVNLGACVAALAMVIDPALAPFDVLIGERPGGVAFALLVVVGVGAAFGALTVLPGPRPGSRASDESGAASA
jgi:hypothetical protein